MSKIVNAMRNDDNISSLIEGKVLNELANLYAREIREMQNKASILIWKKLFTLYLKNLYVGNRIKVLPVKNTLESFNPEIKVLLEQISHILDSNSYMLVCRGIFYYTLNGRKKIIQN